MELDPFARIPSSPLVPRPALGSPQPASSGGLETWKIALGIGLGAVVLLFLAIVASATLGRGSSSATPQIAETPDYSAAPALPTAAVPAMPAPSPSATPLVPLPTVDPAAPMPTLPPAGGSSARNKIQQLQPVEAKAQFQYGWKRGQSYRYGFEIRTEGTPDNTGAKRGVVEYELTDLPRSSDAAEGDDKPHASGTAFVVHSDGLLMTCHHVVAGSSALKVHLGGKQYAAEVVAIDEPNDLALIRIDASGLPALKLGDSDAVRLAENVKAVGFPLSDVLGRTVKITSGTIAGKVASPEGDRLQVDIAINPGNSGGPLVNDRGEVVGVNAAGLFGNAIQEVSFAVPSNLGRIMLMSLGIDGNGQASAAALDGPDLAAKVTPATAFVEVELGNDGAVLLQFTGSSRSSGAFLQPPQQITSRVAASLTGDLLGAQQDLPLGFGLGTFGTMVLETLPADGQKQWHQRRVLPLSMAGMSRGAQSVISLLLEERIEYELKSVDDAQIVIGKKITLSTIGQSSMGTVRMTGQGEWVFDRIAGVPQKMELQVDSHINLGGTTNDFRGTTRYERLSDDGPSPWQTELQRELAQAAASEPDNSGLPDLPEMPPLALEPSDEPELIAALRILKNKRKQAPELLAALETLSRMAPVERRRDEVATALHNLRTTLSADMSVWLLAVRAWGTDKNVPTVLYVLDAPTSNLNERILAIEALGRLPATKETARAVLRYLSDDRLAGNALQAIGAMGAAAEEPAAELLKRSEVEQRIIGCAVLARIGTGKSVPVLENYLRSETDARCRTAGLAALNVLRQRSAASPSSGSLDDAAS